ncbi:MAG: FAD:protein FMN transferase [Rhodobacteraceae bacterium]|nr:FAD:protein FMN transferase [Paracoccaceae bacterium]
MKMTRRRFLSVSAATLVASAAHASTARWQGRAMGAEVSLVLHGGTQQDLDAAVTEIRRVERLFSIYDPTSELSHLNKNSGGRLSPDTQDLLALCDSVHRTTDGLFDPTVQPVFRAALHGRALPWHLVGWDRVRIEQGHLTMAKGQQLTLNGIAQGYATDQVRDLLTARGFAKALVSVGEHSAIGGPFRLQLEDPIHGPLGLRTLEDSAIATSSPNAMQLGVGAHIFDPTGRAVPLWSTVSVEAKSAALADGLSTALCMAPRDQIAQIAGATGTRITLIDRSGDLTRLG